MDGASLVLGIPGSVANCIDLLGHYESYKSFERDAQTTIALVAASKVRLLSWATEVGISDGVVQPKHHPSLDDPIIVASVQTLLNSLAANFEAAESVPIETQRRSSKGGIVDINPEDEPTTFSLKKRVSTLRGGVKWATQTRMRLKGSAENILKLVDAIYAVLPPERTQDDKLARIDAEVFQRARAEDRNTAREWLQVQDIKDRMKVKERFEGARLSRAPNTCRWITQNAAFQTWLKDGHRDEAKTFWLVAAAGFGKSIIAAWVADYLEMKRNYVVANFFFTQQALPDDPVAIIRAWLAHLSFKSRPVLDIVLDARRKAPDTERATRSTIWDIFSEVVRQVPDLVFMIDGMDECRREDLNRFDFIRKVLKAISGTPARFWISSRDENDTRNAI